VRKEGPVGRYRKKPQAGKGGPAFTEKGAKVGKKGIVRGGRSFDAGDLQKERGVAGKKAAEGKSAFLPAKKRGKKARRSACQGKEH